MKSQVLWAILWHLRVAFLICRSQLSPTEITMKVCHNFTRELNPSIKDVMHRIEWQWIDGSIKNHLLQHRNWMKVCNQIQTYFTSWFDDSALEFEVSVSSKDGGATMDEYGWWGTPPRLGLVIFFAKRVGLPLDWDVIFWKRLDPPWLGLVTLIIMGPPGFRSI